MRLDPNPLFRRVITPWYDSTAACWMELLAMVVLMLFSWAGISLALSRDDFRAHIWLPATLLVLSLCVFFSVLYRLIRRRSDHQSQPDGAHWGDRIPSNSD